MINIANETLITLAEAATRLGVSKNTVRQWTKLKDRPLEAVTLGGKTLRTSLEAIQRFSVHEQPGQTDATELDSFESSAESRREYEKSVESLRINHGIIIGAGTTRGRRSRTGR